MKENHKTIGILTRNLSNQIKRNLDKIATESGIEGMTGLHHMFIGYLKENQKQDIFQKDMEKRFCVRRSTATGILQLMEKNELIVRIPVDQDARLKKIVLTQRAIEIKEKHYQKLMLLEDGLRKGLTEEEINSFFSITEKILENAKNMEGENDDKEVI